MGYLFVLLGSFIFGVVPTLQAVIMDQGVTPILMVLICNGIACLTGLTAGILKGDSFKVKPFELLMLMVAGIIGLFFTDYFLNVAYTFIPVGFVTTIHFLYPSLVCLAMAVFFGEKMTKAKAGAMVISIVGLVLVSFQSIIGGDLSQAGPGFLAAITTAFAYCIYTIANGVEPLSSMPLFVRTFWLNFFVALTAGTMIVVRGDNGTMPHNILSILACLLAGILFAVANSSINAGISMIGPDKASFTNMLEPVISVIVSMLVYHYTVSIMEAVGCFFIVISLFLISRGESSV